jgi:predicted nuclease with TOPRIM domain
MISHVAMPSPTGFKLRRLLVLGTHVEPAELVFRVGLNVIVGPSDTGKSFAFECLDYMLGGKDRPRDLDRAKRYDRIVLEIESLATGEVFTAERPLARGKVQWYASAFDKITKDTPVEVLAPTHSPTSAATLSYKLLELCGLAGRVLKKNQKNETRTVSIRNVAKFVLVDEERIITKQSPALGEQKTDETADKSLFRLLLTGRDDAGLVAAEGNSENRRRLEAQADVLQSLLTTPPLSDAADLPNQAELIGRRMSLDRKIEELSRETEQTADIVDEMNAEREAVEHTIQAERSRMLVIDELLKRFRLLNQSYATDLERLEFIAEGHHYFAQLSVVTCPVCNRRFDDTDSTAHAMCVPGSTEADDVQSACAREAEKIRVHLRDLSSAMDELIEERSALVQTIQNRSSHYRELQSRIDREYRPRLANAAKELTGTIAVREKLVRDAGWVEQRAAISARWHEIIRTIQEIASNAISFGTAELPPFESFAEEVGALLREWGYPHASVITFDPSTMDIVVGGEARAMHGKGVRAIMFAAFIIGLMRFCRAYNLPHPGFTVLDSPLTTYRAHDRRRTEVDITTGQEINEEISTDMQHAFFKHLAETTARNGEQVVVLENKEPPAELLTEMNYVHFTGVPGMGRSGFLPE